jgi:hypothetical protein
VMRGEERQRWVSRRSAARCQRKKKESNREGSIKKICYELSAGSFQVHQCVPLVHLSAGVNTKRCCWCGLLSFLSVVSSPSSVSPTLGDIPRASRLGPTRRIYASIGKIPFRTQLRLCGGEMLLDEWSHNSIVLLLRIYYCVK